MKFWDTSAIVPLLVIEPSTETAKSILTEDSSVLFGGEQEQNAFQLSILKSATEVCATKTNARHVMSCKRLVEPGMKCSRANYSAAPQRGYWLCILLERRTPFS